MSIPADPLMQRGYIWGKVGKVHVKVTGSLPTRETNSHFFEVIPLMLLYKPSGLINSKRSASCYAFALNVI